MPDQRANSSVRDHLANERTYLAWLRTGIALVGLGFVIAKLAIDLPQRAPLEPHSVVRSAGVAVIFVVAGLLTVAFGTWRFLAVERMIGEAHFEPLGYRALWISAAFLGMGAAVLAYLWTRAL